MNEEKDFLSINKHRLDEEWLNQPSLIKEWTRKLADARQEQDEAKSNLDVVEAETSLAIRKNPKAFKIDNATEAAIKSSVLLQESYRSAQRTLFKTKHRVDVYQGICNALEHRKRALTMLVELHGRDYFSNAEITGSKKLREMAKEDTKTTTRKVGRFLREEDKDED